MQRYKLGEEYENGSFLSIINELDSLINNENIEKTNFRTKIENRLYEIWSGTLGIKKIALNDNFFEIGGNSILLADMITQIEAEYPSILQIQDAFEAPTIESLARQIEEVEAKNNK
ncbi:MAG TPA: phosphopantetheine-binding protein [Ruminiclostridium sp.]|nr:phosphopantetheine-binding protein [Ruminiclostridium sp.]